MSDRHQRIRSRILSIVIGLGLLVAGGAWPGKAGAQEELFVTNGNNASVTVYSRTANGNALAVRNLQGPATGLSGPRGLFVDPFHDELVVANSNSNSITVYAVS